MIRFLSSLFEAKEMNDLDLYEIGEALTDLTIRRHWIKEVLREIKSINLAIDRNLLDGNFVSITEQSARRKALQWVLEQILQSKNSVELERSQGNKRDNQDENPFEGLAVQLD